MRSRSFLPFCRTWENLKKLDNGLKTKITYEISQIDELVDKAGVLVSLCKTKEPDFIELNDLPFSEGDTPQYISHIKG